MHLGQRSDFDLWSQDQVKLLKLLSHLGVSSNYQYWLAVWFNVIFKKGYELQEERGARQVLRLLRWLRPLSRECKEYILLTWPKEQASQGIEEEQVEGDRALPQLFSHSSSRARPKQCQQTDLSISRRGRVLERGDGAQPGKRTGWNSGVPQSGQAKSSHRPEGLRSRKRSGNSRCRATVLETEPSNLRGRRLKLE